MKIFPSAREVGAVRGVDFVGDAPKHLDGGVGELHSVSVLPMLGDLSSYSWSAVDTRRYFGYFEREIKPNAV